jgi:hypothetical protein
MLEKLLTPRLLKTAGVAAGIEAARFDVDPARGQLHFSVIRDGRIYTWPIPLGRTYTWEEITQLLTAPHAAPPAAKTVPPDHPPPT